ncbi:beta strand repeat-containing protein, partial [Trabulsiella guamensis]|uniref:beta strand repeat-containing protein n=1 Tax=Trabulsiella guamensis TaxID=158852 RepID=UPI0014701A9D
MGSQSIGIAVTNPATNITTTITTYDTSKLYLGSNSGTTPIYSPSPTGSGPFVDAKIAEVSGGGTFNMNASGAVNASVKNTTYIDVTDGTANWNSVNAVGFAGDAAGIDSSAFDPRTITASNFTFAGNFTVTLADGSTVQKTVNNLDDLKNYNTWLQQQVAAKNFGSGSAAQNAYNSAFNKAYIVTNYQYTLTPPSIPADDPAMIPAGERIVMRANGANAIAQISSTGGINIGSAGGAMSAIVLKAKNGGTAINDGIINVTGQNVKVFDADSGGHIINNGVESRTNSTNVVDTITGAGTTLENYGTVNMGGTTVNGGWTSKWLEISNNATATNNGAVNIGTTIDGNVSGNPNIINVTTGGAFINAGADGSANGYAGVIYLGREASVNTSSDPVSRGGDDVVHTGYTGIRGASDSTVKNDGQIIIGTGMQNSNAIVATGTNVNVTVGKDGVITDNGNYPVAAGNAPLRNAAIYSNATSGTVNNDGTINLNGANGAGLYTYGGGIASSSGT